MRSRGVIQLLLLALVMGSGCAGRDYRYYSAPYSSAPAPIVRFLPLSENPPTTAPSIPAAEPARMDIFKFIESVGNQPLAPANGAGGDSRNSRADNRVAPAKASSAPTPPPANNNQLVDLLEKDIDKAVEQPRERRRLQFSKDVVEHPRVRQYIQQYSVRQKHYFQTVLARSGKYLPIIAKVLGQEGLPEEIAYLALVESEFQVGATSPAGAGGLWQFIPSTALQYGLRIDDWLDERRDPVKSTRAAAAYLKDLHNYFGRWSLATAAYNAGPSVIDRALQTSKAADFWGIKGKAQLSNETRNFVPKFVAIALIASDPKKYGFTNLRYDEPLQFDEVLADGLVKLDAAAEMADTDVASIRALNPALLRNVTPPGASYRLRVPQGRGLVFAKATEHQRNKETESGPVVTHVVKRGETLGSIAALYGQAISALMEVNGLASSKLQIGQTLRIIYQGIRDTLR